MCADAFIARIKYYTRYNVICQEESMILREMLVRTRITRFFNQNSGQGRVICYLSATGDLITLSCAL